MTDVQAIRDRLDAITRKSRAGHIPQLAEWVTLRDSVLALCDAHEKMLQDIRGMHRYAVAIGAADGLIRALEGMIEDGTDV